MPRQFGLGWSYNDAATTANSVLIAAVPAGRVYCLESIKFTAVRAAGAYLHLFACTSPSYILWSFTAGTGNYEWTDGPHIMNAGDTLVYTPLLVTPEFVRIECNWTER